MTAEATSPLENLVLEALERIDADGWGELEAICQAHPDVAATLRRRVRKLLDVGLIAPPWEGPRPVPDRLGDFRLIEKIGGGGMGLVYRAEQLSLGREVALKIVRPEQLWFGGARQRFLREVEIVAGLSHPGIVPVYAVGEEDGVPFFAMERVCGASLGEVIARLRAGSRSPVELSGDDLAGTLVDLVAEAELGAIEFLRGSWPDVCARIGREVAEALDHAHRRGVLHRDVKPSNVMITLEGRVLLLDFGLSSTGAANEGEADPDRLTRTGTAIGSVPYMSPEQVRAEGKLDERTDVYSLGVLLYELLTLQLPFEDDSVVALAERITSGTVQPVAERNPSVSWEVATIIATAMDVDREQRYASAADFARDLGHVLARRPIEARPPGPGLRTRRWIQRHPTTAVAILAAFLLFVIAPSVFAWREWQSGLVITGQRDELERTNRSLVRTNDELGRVNRELGQTNLALSGANSALERSLAATESERARAERHFQRAYEAVESMLERVGWEALKGVPGMEEVRRDLLSHALAYHEEFLAEKERDPTQRELFLRTLQRIGELRTWLNEFDGAAAALGERKTLLTAILEESGHPEDAFELARTHYRLAEVESLTFAHDEAIRDALVAIELLEPLSARQPGAFSLLGRARVELGNSLQRAGRIAEGRAILEDATEELRRYVEEHPRSTAELAALAEALFTLGKARPMAILSNQQDEEEMRQAEAWLNESIELRRRLVEIEASPAAKKDLAETLNTLGTIYMSQARTAEARRAFEDSRAEFLWLHRGFPGVPFFSEGLATTCMNLTTLMRHYEESDDWGEPVETALGVFAELAAAHPGHRQFESMHFYALRASADAHLELERDADAAARLGWQALELGNRLLDAFGDPLIDQHLDSTCYMLARAEAALGRHERAAELVHEVQRRTPFTLAEDWAYFAQHLVPCIEAAEADPALGRFERRDVARDYADEVAAALEEARALGLDAAQLRQVFALPAWSGVLDHPSLAEHVEAAGLRSTGDQDG